MPADTTLLLDLLREAGEEAVTLDELEIVGVVDPAEALRRLEEAGHHLQRVIDTSAAGAELETIRLAAREEAAERGAIDWPTFEWPQVAPAAVTADVPETPEAPETPETPETPAAASAPAPAPATARIASLGVVALLLLLTGLLVRRRETPAGASGTVLGTVMKS